ncbi:pyruvate dehydrogenase complex dihydrolipoamide acetyltransferase [Sphingosinicellaceae bacterium]|nr:pyruvate dehydrogenase complex dihydrolipoamide acetyltransferase [Sphingosinicellaceae bacterium]
MPIDITMPALSPTMETGTLSKWLVKVGDTVKSGDVLAEIETDKATMEVESIDEGVVLELLTAEGTDGVPVGQVIMRLGGEGEAAAPAPAKAPEAKAPVEPEAKAPTPGADAKSVVSPRPSPEGEGETAPSPSGEGPRDGAAGPGVGSAPAVTPPPTASAADRVNASPLARRLAQAQNIDLAAVKGSGPNGRIVKADLEGAPVAKSKGNVDAAFLRRAVDTPTAAAPKPEAAPSQPSAHAPAAKPAALPPPEGVPAEAIKLSNMRKTIARRLTESKQTVPHFYLTVDVRLDALLKLRGELNKSLEASGVKLSVNDLVIKAVGLALTQVPDANVQFAGDTLYKFGRADISVAVAIPGGLITPIIRDAANKRLSVIAAEMKDLAARAKDGKLLPDEYNGGTASISNLGMFGIKQFDAVINPPQGLILAVGAGEKRPYVVDDALAIATVMSATGSFDHRAIDGAVGAQFMAALKALIEAPMGMLA